MQFFTDTLQRKWVVTLDFGKAAKIKTELGLDILDPMKTNIFAAWGQNPYLIGEMAWVCVEAQAKSQELSKDDFYAGIDGDLYESLADVLMGALIDFFPRAKRPVIRTMYDRAKTQAVKLEAEAIKMATEQLESGKLEEFLTKHFHMDSGNSSGHSQAD